MDYSLPSHLADPQSQAESEEMMSRLEAGGVRAMVLKESRMITLAGGGDMLVLAGAILVVGADEERAREIWEAYCTEEEAKDGGAIETPVAWTCATCGESHAADMTHCWSCGGTWTGGQDPETVAGALHDGPDDGPDPEAEAEFEREAAEHADRYGPPRSREVLTMPSEEAASHPVQLSAVLLWILVGVAAVFLAAWWAKGL